MLLEVVYESTEDGALIPFTNSKNLGSRKLTRTQLVFLLNHSRAPTRPSSQDSMGLNVHMTQTCKI